jgi:hypothetical protein
MSAPTHLGDLRDRPGFVYLATPYTNFAAGRDAAFQMAAFYAGLLLKAGFPAFSPIAHSHPIARAVGIDETDHALWVAADRPFVEAASALIVLTLDGWRESRGVAHEIAAFSAAGKPIVYAAPDEVLALARETRP